MKQVKILKYYKIEESKHHPGFFYVVSRNFLDDDNYLLNTGRIDTGYGEAGQKPEDMKGLWPSFEEADFFLLQEDKRLRDKSIQKQEEKREYCISSLKTANDDVINEVRSLLSSIEAEKKQKAKQAVCEHDWQWSCCGSHTTFYDCPKCKATKEI